MGKVSFGGISKAVNLALVPDARVGDYLLVHVGVAIGVVDEAEARLTFQYLKEIGEVDDLETGAG
jgi:hydrogenase expression/formation protein HypC